eukprot:CAMPEP_0174275526 /NCGR_PEP_ID=MMETSP0439-20130205/59873_1 /TAXON_ID=0 /ORGANISM="Stereomyxa ramosa, Strain Chinc5" /LENGTH=442 /DNA_ID=CAMNT_0015367637 /DNA_START=847 /DNA_END=2175 /DNA_ORIENTATION=+
MIGLNTLGILAKDSGMEEEAYSLQNATKCFMSATYIRVEETTESNVEYDKTVTSIKDAIKDLSETANRLKLKAEHDVEEMNKGVDKDTEKTLKMRANIVKELFETENNYLDNLKFILKFFVTPFKELSGEGDKDSKKVLSHDAIQCVLEALPTIVDLTTKIRSDILSRMASNDPDLGSIFLEHAPLLSVYSDYVNNYGVASTKLREGRKKSRAVDKLLKKLEDQGETQDFDFYLIIPIQRPPRYELLLREMEKYTLKESRSLANLKLARSKIKVINNIINLRKKEAENREKIVDIQNHLKGKNLPDLLVTGRLFVREGGLEIVTKNIFHRDSGSDYYFFMFNDILMKTEKSGGLFKERTFTFKDIIRLETVTLENVENEDRHMFALIPDVAFEETDPKKQLKLRKKMMLRLECASLIEKEQWFKELADAIKVNKLMAEMVLI